MLQILHSLTHFLMGGFFFSVFFPGRFFIFFSLRHTGGTTTFFGDPSLLVDLVDFIGVKDEFPAWHFTVLKFRPGFALLVTLPLSLTTLRITLAPHMVLSLRPSDRDMIRENGTFWSPSKHNSKAQSSLCRTAVRQTVIFCRTDKYLHEWRHICCQNIIFFAEIHKTFVRQTERFLKKKMPVLSDSPALLAKTDSPFWAYSNCKWDK